jgi:ABC-2 type transport system permease protein
MSKIQTYLFTIRRLYILLLRRYLRSRTALFFSIIFPLIFLFIFGSLYGSNSDTSFKVAVINDSKTPFSQQFAKQVGESKVFKLQQDITTYDQAKQKMKQSQIDAAIVLPSGFGAINSQGYPGGQAIVYYDQNSAQSGQTVSSVLNAILGGTNAQITHIQPPLTVEAKSTAENGLTAFDYVFAGLVGFSLIGLGIFGPINMLPAEKKTGALTRLRVTPLHPAQFIIAYMFSSLTTGILSITAMFLVATFVFHFHMVGNYLVFALFTLFGAIMMFGIGVGVGGWARDEKQAAPLSNLVAFPMMFLSGTFFPRFLMPEWLQHASAFLPLTPVIEGIRMITTEGKGFLQIGPEIGLMALWTLVIYVIAFRVFRWE